VRRITVVVDSIECDLIVQRCGPSKHYAVVPTCGSKRYHEPVEVLRGKGNAGPGGGVEGVGGVAVVEGHRVELIALGHQPPRLPDRVIVKAARDVVVVVQLSIDKDCAVVEVEVNVVMSFIAAKKGCEEGARAGVEIGIELDGEGGEEAVEPVGMEAMILRVSREQSIPIIN
jgi:hypothetical protein